MRQILISLCFSISLLFFNCSSVRATGDGDLSSSSTSSGDTCNDISDSIGHPQVATGFTTSVNKVFFEAPTEFSGSITDQAELSLAKREYEALQLVLFPSADINSVTVSVSNLTKADCTVIPASDIEINVVGYVNLTEAKVNGDRIGWIPDPLLPNQALDLNNGVLQPYLITVQTHEDTAAGEYHGYIDVSINGALAVRTPLTVHVWDFALPLVSKFKTMNFASRDTLRTMWSDLPSGEAREPYMVALAELGFRNRLPPTMSFASGLISWNWNGEGNTTYGYPTHDGTTFNAERTDELIDFMLERGANHFFLGLTSDVYATSNTDTRVARLTTYLQDYTAHLLDRGLLDMVYVYNIDEVWGAEEAQRAHDIYNLIKSVNPNLKVLQNSNENNNTMFQRFLGYFDAFDINLGFYDVHDSDTYRQQYPDQLKDFWWNVNIWPDAHPNLFVEYPLLDARIIGSMSFRYNIQGFEYWQVFSKSSIGNYHPIEPDELRVNWDVDNKSLDGSLVYPSSDKRIFSSLRYESFRDGMEDQEYLYLLRDLDPTHPLLEVPIITGLNTFTQDQDVLMAFRRNVAEAIMAKLHDSGICGDINHDNDIDLTDLILVLRTAVNENDAIGVSGDCNGNGKIGMVEALEIIKGLKAQQ